MEQQKRPEKDLGRGPGFLMGSPAVLLDLLLPRVNDLLDARAG
jgi:hypothetical protein